MKGFRFLSGHPGVAAAGALRALPGPSRPGGDLQSPATTIDQIVPGPGAAAGFLPKIRLKGGPFDQSTSLHNAPCDAVKVCVQVPTWTTTATCSPIFALRYYTGHTPLAFGEKMSAVRVRGAAYWSTSVLERLRPNECTPCDSWLYLCGSDVTSCT